MIDRAAIVTAARRWIDTPYVDQHSRVCVGADCLGLILGVGRDVGTLTAYRPPAYTPNPDGKMLRREADAALVPVYQRVQPGMVGLFWYAHRRWPQHLAIFTDYRGLGMIHALSGHAVREHSINSFWSLRFVRAYDFPGVADG